MKKNLEFVFFGIMSAIFIWFSGTTALQGKTITAILLFVASFICIAQVASDEYSSKDKM